MQKPIELTDQAWAHFIMANMGRTEEEMEQTLETLLVQIAQVELQYYKSMGGKLQ